MPFAFADVIGTRYGAVVTGRLRARPDSRPARYQLAIERWYERIATGLQTSTMPMIQSTV
jgi:hypothetical protein